MLEQKTQRGGKDMACKIKFIAAYAVMNAPHAQGIFPSAELVASQGTPMLSAPQHVWHPSEGAATWPGSPVYSIAPEPQLGCLTAAQQPCYASIFFHSLAANGNTGLSGQAQWLPIAVTTRDCAPRSPTVPSSHATTRVKRVSAPKARLTYTPVNTASAKVEDNISVVTQEIVRANTSRSGSPVVVIQGVRPEHATSDPCLCTDLCTQKGL